ncbi:MAG TPA: pyridoxal-phosphate dependent enzyme [Puia sp.]|nr:pyridoxal-phosphate dependent enzyme [Puia sp.]
MAAIGNTPVLKLERLSEPGCADIYVKYEGANHTGSMKDRMALAMIEGLPPEPTSGPPSREPGSSHRVKRSLPSS